MHAASEAARQPLRLDRMSRGRTLQRAATPYRGAEGLRCDKDAPPGSGKGSAKFEGNRAPIALASCSF